MDRLHHRNGSFIHQDIQTVQDSILDFHPPRSSTPIQRGHLPPSSTNNGTINPNRLRKTPSSSDLPLSATLPLSFGTAYHARSTITSTQPITIPSTNNNNNNNTPSFRTSQTPFYRKAREILNLTTSTNSNPTNSPVESDRAHLPDPFNPYGGSHHDLSLLYGHQHHHQHDHSRHGEGRSTVGDDLHLEDEYDFLHQGVPRRDSGRRSVINWGDRSFEFEDYISSGGHHQRSQQTQTTPSLPLTGTYVLSVDQKQIDHPLASPDLQLSVFLPSRPKGNTVRTSSSLRRRSASVGEVSGIASSPTLPPIVKEQVQSKVKSGQGKRPTDSKVMPLGISRGKVNTPPQGSPLRGDPHTAQQAHPAHQENRNSASQKVATAEQAKAKHVYKDHILSNMRPAPSPPPMASSRSPSRSAPLDKVASLAPSPSGQHTSAYGLTGQEAEMNKTSNRRSAPNGAPMPSSQTLLHPGSQAKSLSKPKSKLRLRLKLTPPYDPEEIASKSEHGHGGQVQQPVGLPRDPKTKSDVDGRQPERAFVIDKKAQVQGLGLGLPDHSRGPSSVDKGQRQWDGENHPPSRHTLEPSRNHAGLGQARGHARAPSTVSKVYPAGIGGIGLGGAHDRQTSYGNTFPSNAAGGGIRGANPTQARPTPGGQRYPPEHLQQQHIVVQRPALTAQTFQGPPHQGEFGQSSEYDRRHAVADSHVPKLYESALGVGIHQAPSPEAIRRAQSAAYATGTVETMSTITPYNATTVSRRGQGGDADAQRDSGRYLSPSAETGQTTRTWSTSLAGQQVAIPSFPQAGDRLSAYSSVNLSLTLSRENSGISLAPGSPASPLRHLAASGGIDGSPARSREPPVTKALASRPSKEELSTSYREATPSSFGNVNASIDSGARGLGDIHNEDGREVLADTHTRLTATNKSPGGEDTWNESVDKVFTAYSSGGDPTVYPNDLEVDSTFLEQPGDSSPFSQDKHGLAQSDKSRAETYSKSIVSEKTDSTAMTEEKIAGETSASDQDNSLDSATTGETSGRSEGKRGEVKPHEGVTDIFTITDQQLSDSYKFVQELGYGNWGSVWQVKPKAAEAHPMYRHKVKAGLSPIHPSVSSQHHPQKLAIKLVHRTKTPTTAARVRALWSEMKIVRALREAPHPSIIGFDSFVITPSYALIIMPCLAELIPVNLKLEKAKGYFRQLASAVAYLHDNGITHNDIKPSNIMTSHANVPVLVDFGFAQKWEMAGTPKPSSSALNGKATEKGASLPYKPYWSEICWGTPEYLSPQRAKGEHHDERSSDVWALGIAFFEILNGRTPFEVSEEEDFSTPEQLAVYFDRTVSGQWVGEWSMKPDMEALLQTMIMPDVHSRMTAAQVANSSVLHAVASAAISTPPFVRDAAAYNAHRAHKPAKKRKSVKAEAIVQWEPHALSKIDKLEASSPGPIIAGERNAGPAAVQAHRAIAKQPDEGVEVIAQSSTPTATDAPRAVAPSAAASPPSKTADQAAAPAHHMQGMYPIHEKVVRRVQDFDSSGKDLTRQRSFDQPRPLQQADGGRDIHTIRRPASALALRSTNELGQLREVQTENGPEDQDRRQILRSNFREKSRHVRVQSDSNLLAAASPATGPQSAAHASGLRSVIADKWVHFAAPATNQEVGPLRAEEEVRMTPPTPAIAAPEALQRLDRIAGWIKDVEKIVATAREALEEAQVESRNSHALSQDEQAEILETIEMVEGDGQAGKFRPITSEPKIRHSRTASAFSTFAEPATPPGWARPSFDLEEWKPTHLRRQRSDLTGMNVKSSFKPVASASSAQVLLQPLRDADGAGGGRVLRTHKSAGDLGKVAQSSRDPYDALLTGQPGVARVDDGWGSAGMKPKEKTGFAKKDNGFKGWLTSVKAKFGKKA